jgi:hypothetical protein
MERRRNIVPPNFCTEMVRTTQLKRISALRFAPTQMNLLHNQYLRESLGEPDSSLVVLTTRLAQQLSATLKRTLTDDEIAVLTHITVL